MDMQDKAVAVGVYKTKREALDVMGRLNQSGFPMRNVSLIGKDLGFSEKKEEKSFPVNLPGPSHSLDTFWKNMYGGCVGMGFISIPEIGDLMVVGAVTRILLEVTEESTNTGPCSSLQECMIKMGIKENDVFRYNEQLSHGHSLVITQGNPGEITYTEQILQKGIKSGKKVNYTGN